MADLLSRLFSRQSDDTKKTGNEPARLRPGQVLRGTVVGRGQGNLLEVRAAGRNLMAPSNLRLPVGSQVEVTIKQVEPTLELSLAPAGRGAPDGPPVVMAGQTLFPGRVITATVLGPSAGGLFEVSMFGERLLAESKVPLTAGQAVKLVVAETQPQVVLALAEEGEAPGAADRLPGLLQGVFSGNQSLAHNLRHILAFDLDGAGLPKAVRLAAGRVREAARELVEPGPDPLRRAVKAAGLNLEAQLAAAAKQPDGLQAAGRGLRPLVMALERAMAAEVGRPAATADRPGGFASFASAAEQVGSFFDNLAGLNAELAPRDNQVLMAVAMALGDQLESGELLVGLADQEQEGEEPGHGAMTLAFLLRLSALGPVAIEARMAGKSIAAVFTATGEDQARFIGQRLGGLAERLEALGYQASLTARHRPARQVEEAAPLVELIRRHGQYLSVKV